MFIGRVRQVQFGGTISHARACLDGLAERPCPGIAVKLTLCMERKGAVFQIQDYGFEFYGPQALAALACVDQQPHTDFQTSVHARKWRLQP